MIIYRFGWFSVETTTLLSPQLTSLLSKKSYTTLMTSLPGKHYSLVKDYCNKSLNTWKTLIRLLAAVIIVMYLFFLCNFIKTSFHHILRIEVGLPMPMATPNTNYWICPWPSAFCCKCRRVWQLTWRKCC